MTSNDPNFPNDITQQAALRLQGGLFFLARASLPHFFEYPEFVVLTGSVRSTRGKVCDYPPLKRTVPDRTTNSGAQKCTANTRW